MRDISSKQWRAFLSGRKRIHVYTVDPGAHAIAVELVPLLRDMGCFGFWFVEGWCAAREPACPSAAAMSGALAAKDTIIVGSQTNFERTQIILRQAAEIGVETIFIFDHWKNFAEHFGLGVLPQAIVVPDDIARKALLLHLDRGASTRVHVLTHLGIEAAVDRVLASGISTEAGVVALLLDPTELSDGLGYDWRSVLAAATERACQMQKLRILVKPHPRQDRDVVDAELEVIRRRGVNTNIFSGETENLIALAEEIWGMTTSALNVALVAGKPIRSFQPGRNAAGLDASNPHLEPFVVI